MKQPTIKTIFLVTLAAMAVLVASGCMRKHIVSSPPAQKPGVKAAATPAPKPKEPVKKPEIIEEVYVVDGPTDDTPPVVIREGELAEEAPTAAPMKEIATETPAEKQAVDDAAAKAEKETVQPALADLYYVQIGAFGDLENANKALARLLSDGYKGSMLSKTDDGLYRVQAGAFPDETSAGEALSKLLADYPKGFILKNPATD